MSKYDSQFYFTQDADSGKWLCIEEYKTETNCYPSLLVSDYLFSNCVEKARLHLKRRETRIPWDGVSDIEPPAS